MTKKLRKLSDIYNDQEIKLRNEFAGRAMQEMIAGSVNSEDYLGPDAIAELSYAFADAMVLQSRKDIMTDTPVRPVAGMTVVKSGA